MRRRRGDRSYYSCHLHVPFLDCGRSLGGWRLHTAVGDGAKEFWLEEEITESRGVDADIRSLLRVFAVRRGPVGGRAGGRDAGFGGRFRLERFLVFLIVDQVLVVV